MDAPAVQVDGLTHAYPPSRRSSSGDASGAAGSNAALRGVSLRIAPKQIVGVLGPNGSGKSTLFKILCTLLTPQQGSVRVLDLDVAREATAVRRRIGVLFQSPSLDKKLTVRENLRHQGHLYGLSGAALRRRIDELLARYGLAERAAEIVGTLSGGLARRVELAKAMIHSPSLLLLDEPSTGLDPGIRRELWDHLRELRRDGVTVFLSTHLLEEAEQCDRIVILDRGQVVEEGVPDQLRGEVGGDVILLETPDAEGLQAKLKERFGTESTRQDGTVRIESGQGHAFVARLLEAFPEMVRSSTVRRPTLEDLFLRKTGHRFYAAAPSAPAKRYHK